jgi:hypothetical protein
VGTWSGTQAVRVRLQATRGPGAFVSDTVPIAITIRADGEIEGHVGGARLENAYVLKNRGAFGRLIHVATDFRIEGRLQGAVFAADTRPTKDIRVPLSLERDTLSGALFHVAGMGLYPMADLRLTKR